MNNSGYGLKTQIPPLHHVFTGNPGTGTYACIQQKHATYFHLLCIFILNFFASYIHVYLFICR